MNKLPMYLDCKYISYKNNTDKIFEDAISIPSSSNLSEQDQNKVIRFIKNIIIDDFPDINEFINSKVINRNTSLFSDDIINNQASLKKEIFGKSALVIGGAGTIGTSFIKAMLKYEPRTLVVVDINENGLTELTRTLRSDNNIKVLSFILLILCPLDRYFL